MGRPPRWVKKDIVDGTWTIRLSSWKNFHDYVTQEMLDYSHYVWRGDRLPNRPLLPSFDRNNPGVGRDTIEKRLAKHLDTFKEATRGRRGSSPSKLESENDWWALGQHLGLDTPLLDWTHSPFVALFFAFEKESSDSSYRAVYAISPPSCDEMNRELEEHMDPMDPPDIAYFYSPQQDENSRLVNQGGLFSRCSPGISLKNWVNRCWEGENKKAILIRLLIPNSGRLECLRALNKMNINYLTLFPDLYGASMHANTVNRIPKY